MSTPEKETLRQALFNRRMLICVFTGFSSGLPLYILISLLPAWLKSEGVDLKAIGLFALIQLPFTWKFLWAPLMDRYIPPLLGRRRGWLFVTQVLLLLTIPGFGLLDPQTVMHSAHSPAWLHGWLSSTFEGSKVMTPLLSLWEIAWLALALSFWGASQDIVLDAYRREILPDAELGLGNSIHVNAYRIAGLIPGSLSLILADHMSWDSVFLITGLFMLPGLIMTLVVSEPKVEAQPPKTLRQSLTEPFKDFFQHNGIKQALLILLFMFIYKLGDSMATALATPFYLDMGYTKTEIGIVAKNAGLWASVLGAMIGGLWMIKLGINRALWLFGIVQVVSILGFFWLAGSPEPFWLTEGLQALFRGISFGFALLANGIAHLLGSSTQYEAVNIAIAQLNLGLVVGFEALGVGLGTAAFVAFIARSTNPLYTATQFALFTSLAALPRTLFNAYTGFMVESLGWELFFLACYALAIPGMILLFKVAPWKENGDARG